MVSRLRSWWQQIKQHLVTILVVAIILVGAIVLIIVGYRFDWTGFNGNNKSGKTLWDWIQLVGVLAIPVAVALGTAWFTTKQGQESDKENKDNQHEAALQAYIDKMSELLLANHLRGSTEDEEARKIARVRTLTVLRRLDAERKGSVLLFLQESGLIGKDKRIIHLTGADLNGAHLWSADLSGADLSDARLSDAILDGAHLSLANLSGARLIDAHLSRANLDGANLSKDKLFGAHLSLANLSGADLSEAYLNGANLWGVNLSGADLRGADLSRADLGGANLSEAKLNGAKVTPEQLDKAKLLKDTIMPDGSKHP